MARTSTKAATTEATENTEAPKTRYLATDVGMTDKGMTYAFHLEGNLTRDPELRPAVEDKGSMLLASIGINMGAFALMAKAKGEAVPEDEGKTFITLVLYDELANKFVNEAKKGEKVAICGELKEFTNTKGEKNVEVVVDNYVMLPRNDGKLNTRLTTANRAYTTKDGRNGVSNMATLLTGKIVGLNPLGTDKNGHSLLRCGLKTVNIPTEAIADKVLRGTKAEYDKDAKTIINVVFFGQDAERKAKFLSNGMKIAVTGRVAENSYEDKTSVVVYPQDVSIVEWSHDESSASTATATSAEGFTEVGDVDDGDLPF